MEPNIFLLIIIIIILLYYLIDFINTRRSNIDIINSGFDRIKYGIANKFRYYDY